MISPSLRPEFLKPKTKAKPIQFAAFQRPSSKFKIRSIGELSYQNLLKKNSLESQPALSREDYLRLNSLPRFTKLFYFNSKDQHIKDFLLENGWHCLPRPELIPFASLIYTFNESAALYKSLGPAQVFNHFEHNHVLT